VQRGLVFLNYLLDLLWHINDEIQSLDHCLRWWELWVIFQMDVYIGRCWERTVSKPILYLLHRNVACKQQAGAAVSQIMEADSSEAIVLQEFWERCR